MSSRAQAKDLTYRALITLETESAQSSFREISRSARDDILSHKPHQSPNFPRSDDSGTKFHSPVAGPIRRAPTIFRPTNFRMRDKDHALMKLRRSRLGCADELVARVPAKPMRQYSVENAAVPRVTGPLARSD